MYKVDLEPEQVDNIVIQEMRYHIDSLERDYKTASEGGEYLGVFDNDPIQDSLLIAEHIEAFEKVLRYYSGESTKF